jgi:hypothetical protein
VKRAILTLVLSFFAVIAAIAEDKFPDVPEQHWAQKEVRSANPVAHLAEVVRDLIVDGWNIPVIRYSILVIGSVCLLTVLLNLASPRKSVPKSGKRAGV